MIHHTSRHIFLHDTDASGLIFFGAVSRWLSEAETALFDAIGHKSLGPDGTASPVRSMNVEYLRPLRFRDKCEHLVWVSDVGKSSFTVDHELRHDGEIAVTARIVHVSVTLETMALAPAPEEIRRSSSGAER